MNFLKRALALQARGYRVIPIAKGTKRPVEDGWQTFESSERDIKRWAEGRYKNGNIGILTEDTPAVDLDIYDASMAEEMERWVLAQFGETVVRVGNAPKRALIFRTERPFSKLQCVYSDGTTEHKVEILGKGQQFVAYGVHPDTGREYEWTSLDEPTTLPASSLPVVTVQEMELVVDKFEELATARGWKRLRRSGAARETGTGDDDAFSNMKPVLALTDDKVDDTLLMLTDSDDYHAYLEVGMALHHQYGGSSEGLEKWHEWAQGSDKYSAADLNHRWSSFGHGPDTVTFATLLHRAAERRRDEDKKAFETVVRRIGGAASTELLFTDILDAAGKAISTDLQFDIACKRIQDRAFELTETKPRLETVRKALRGAMPKEGKREVPKWCEGWVFVKRNSGFFNTETGEVLSRQAFDLSHSEFAPEGKPSELALGTFKLPQVYDYTYIPGEERIVRIGRSLFVNRFNENSLPDSTAPTTAEQHAAIKTMTDHVAMLFPDTREQELLLDWLAYNVQFPSEKVTWGVLIQSVDGAGKSWFASLLGAIMGSDNVRSVPGESLKETFTSWAEGRKFIVIEEVRLHGNNKFEVLDKLKPYVANPTAPIRRMQTDGYEIINVASYLLFTNYTDALPITGNDRRYCVLMASLQTGDQMREFNEENPDYFSELFSILSWNADVLRHWFLHRRIADSFNAKGHAPLTHGRQMMQEEASDPEESADLDEHINQGEADLCDLLLDSGKLRDRAFGFQQLRTYGDMLKREGFVKIGKYRNREGRQTTYYTRKFGRYSKMPRERLQDFIRSLIPDDGFD